MRRALTYRFLLAAVLLSLPFSIGDRPAWQGAQAQEAQKEKSIKPKTRQSQVLGKAAFQLIERARELMAEDENDKAFATLQRILNGARFKPYEKAVALHTIGLVHAAMNDYAKTIISFEQAIATGHLPPRIVSDLNYNLAQLYLSQERPKKALSLLEAWFASQEKEPGGRPFAFKAQIYLMLDDLRPAEQAIKKALSKTKEPKQQWTRILLSVLVQQERYAEARPVLEDAVERWPGVKTFWQQLGRVYYEAGDEELAFVTQQAMHIQGMLTTSKELATMAQLYLYHNVPIKAARMLTKGMASGAIEKTEKNYETLAQAYMHAREWRKSIAPLTRAAEISDKGKFYRQLAQAHVQDEKWADSEAALVKALDKGGLESEAESWLLLGISRMRQEKFALAIKAFRKAGDDDDLAPDAFRWIRSIERRLAANR